ERRAKLAELPEQVAPLLAASKLLRVEHLGDGRTGQHRLAQQARPLDDEAPRLLTRAPPGLQGADLFDSFVVQARNHDASVLAPHIILHSSGVRRAYSTTISAFIASNLAGPIPDTF